VVSPEIVNVVEAETVPKAEGVCAPSLCETVTLHRGRGPDRVQKVVTGTQEAQPGPSRWSATGAQREGKAERSAEPRLGVGPAHSTDDAAEGNEVRGGKGSA
jgi:hypothetical protein